MDDDSNCKNLSNLERGRSKSSYSDTDKKKGKRNRSDSYGLYSDDEKCVKRTRKSRSGSSKAPVGAYGSSYGSRSSSGSLEGPQKHRDTRHRHRTRSWSHSSSVSRYGDEEETKGHEKASPSSRKSVDNRKSMKDPRDKSKRESWKNKVYIVGEIMKDSVFHFCDTCQMPIFIYCRLIPCKHIFCYSCGPKYQDKKCPRCDKKVHQTERCVFGSIFMCYQGGSQHGAKGCRRTYLSQRDLDSHVNHRHNNNNKGGNITPQQSINSSPCPIMSMTGAPPPLNMLGSSFINSFPSQFQHQQIQNLLNMPMNSLQNQQMNSSQLIRPMGNILANMSNQSMSVNQQQLNPSQTQLVNHSQGFNLQMPNLNMMSCNMNQNNGLSMVNQNTQNINSMMSSNCNGPSLSSSSQLMVGPNSSSNNMFMQGTGMQNNMAAGNHLLMRTINPGYLGPAGHQPPLMAQLTSLLQQGMSHNSGNQQQQQQHSAVTGRQFQDHIHRQNQVQTGWVNKSVTQMQQINHHELNNN